MPARPRPDKENKYAHINPNTGNPRMRQLSTAQIERNLRTTELAALSHGSIIDLTDDGPQLPPPPPRRKRQSQKNIKRLGILQPSKKR